MEIRDERKNGKERMKRQESKKRIPFFKLSNGLLFRRDDRLRMSLRSFLIGQPLCHIIHL